MPRSRGEGALAWCDISTGDFHVMACPPVRLGPELARLMPKEVLVSDAMTSERIAAMEEIGAAVTPLAPSCFDSRAEARIGSVFGVASLDAFGTFTRPEIAAMGAVIDYLNLTQTGSLPLLRAPRKQLSGQVLQLDAATRRNLELTHALAGGRANTVLSVLDPAR